MRADLGLVGFDQRVDGGGVEIAFLGQHGFERADAQLHLGQFRAVVVMVVVHRASWSSMAASHAAPFPQLVTATIMVL